MSGNYSGLLNSREMCAFYFILCNRDEEALVAQMVKNLPALQRPRFDPGLGRFPRGEHGNPLQYSCLENPMDRGASSPKESLGSQRVGHK